MKEKDKRRRAKLKDLRSDKGFSQGNMAKWLGISRATYIKKEAEYSFTIQELDKMSVILSTTPIKLLMEE